MEAPAQNPKAKTQSGPLLATRLGARSVMIVLAVCMGLQTTSFVLIMPLFSRKLTALGAGVNALSLSSMAYAITSTLMAPLMGILADRIGRRPMVLIPLAVYVCAFTGYWLAPSAQIFILLRGLAGALTAGLTPAVLAIIGDLAPLDRRGQWIGIVNGGASFGWIFGPLVGGLLYDRWGYSIPFALSVGIAGLVFLAALLTIPETRPSDSVQTETDNVRPRRISFLPALRDISHALTAPLINLGILLAVSFIVTFAWAFIEPLLMFYAYDNLGWSSAQLGLVLSVNGIAMMIGEFTLGRSSDRLGRKPILVMGLALFSAQFAGLFLFKNYLPIAASFMTAGLGNALFDPALSASLLDIAPAGYKSTILGIRSTAASLGTVLGPALLIVFTPYLMPQGIFLIAALSVVLMTGICVCLMRKPGSQVNYHELRLP